GLYPPQLSPNCTNFSPAGVSMRLAALMVRMIRSGWPTILVCRRFHSDAPFSLVFASSGCREQPSATIVIKVTASANDDIFCSGIFLSVLAEGGCYGNKSAPFEGKRIAKPTKLVQTF